MSSYVLGFQDIAKTERMVAGGKGANLGELSKLKGVSVPDGFCVSTDAFKRIIGAAPKIDGLLDQLSHLAAEDRNAIGALSAEIRSVIEAAPIPEDIEEEITRFLSRLGETDAYAVRSSATAEDLPTASFAGQQDTYLNIVGKEAIFKHISKCWASLFTERAVTYRIQNGFGHQNVHLSVVVQKMVFPEASGILFTADPVTSNRRVVSIDAGFGLGEALVSGLVSADHYKVRDGKVIDKKISAKKIGIYAVKDGGTKEREIAPEKQNRQTLTDEQIRKLAELGRKIEAHFGCPQDIEWCLADDIFYIVQSRPITTLYPVPEPNDGGYHVYVSVGHQQMMTDPLKPLGLSIFQLTSFGPRFQAGGRLFVEVTPMLAAAESRKLLLDTMEQHDPLMKDALMTIVEREDFIKSLPDDKKEQSPDVTNKGVSWEFLSRFENSPEIVLELIENYQTSIEELKQDIQTKSGLELFDFIEEDIRQLKKIVFDPKSSDVINAAIYASSWINEKMKEWLGEQNAADTLSQSVPNNITSEMGLELLDVADVIRPYPEVVAYLQHLEDDDFLDELVRFDGGQEARNAIYAYLHKYGMRCAGEIDITQPRWSENSAILVPMILNNIKNFALGEANRKFEQGLQEALKKKQELLGRLERLPDGEQKSKETKRMIDLFRNLMGYREYPKYVIVSRYLVYKQALKKEAEQLIQAGAIREKEDIYYLTFEEFREAIRANNVDYRIIGSRKAEYEYYQKLTPPRVTTSDGEIVSGIYKRENLPATAMVGLPVSSGVIEGRARVILHLAEADLEAGDILVTPFTDPSWTPLFVSIKGLVTEVGGLMTHGAVIAREYGLPAVIGVENATKLIKDGQRIRVNGTEGYVELL